MYAKQINESDVKDTFLGLIKLNTKTSTKEVKDELRKNKFWVTQSYVSSVISENYNEWGAIRTHNGLYYEYSIEEEVGQGDSNNSVDNLTKVPRMKILDAKYNDSFTVFIVTINDSNGNTHEIKISSEISKLPNPLYKVYVKDFGNLYVYVSAENYDVLTRHRACYYVSLLLNGYPYSDFRCVKVK